MSTHNIHTGISWPEYKCETAENMQKSVFTNDQVNVSSLSEVNSHQLCLDFISDFLQLLPATPNHLLVPQRGAVRETEKVVKV